MLLETIVVTRLLGLVAGEYPVRVETGAAVDKVKVQRNGQTVATLENPPWVTRVNFGRELAPHELTVIAYDERGAEIARDTQAINLARTNAEVGVLLRRDERGITVVARPRHYAAAKLASIAITLDGRVISRGFTSVLLGAMDPAAIHALGVTARFADGSEATKEVVFGGMFGEEVPLELTPITVRQRKAGKARAACFLSGTQRIAPTAVEKNRATVFFVHNGTVSDMSRKLHHEELSAASFDYTPYHIDDADLAVVFPRSRSVRVEAAKADLFDGEFYQGADGLIGAVLRPIPGYQQTDSHVADAVASAALSALRGGRRAIVLVVRENPPSDRSIHSPQAVRRYLQRVGIPFRVWSLSGVTPELEAQWGPVEDISSRGAFMRASDRLRDTLAEQRIAWLPLAAYPAFNVQPMKDCAYEPLAVLQAK